MAPESVTDSSGCLSCQRRRTGVCGLMGEACLRERRHGTGGAAAGLGRPRPEGLAVAGRRGIWAGPITSGLILRAGCDIREVRRIVRREVVEVVFTSCPHFLLEERAAQVDLPGKA